MSKHATKEAKRKHEEALRNEMLTLATVVSLPWIALISDIKEARNDRSENQVV